MNRGGQAKGAGREAQGPPAIFFYSPGSSYEFRRASVAGEQYPITAVSFSYLIPPHAPLGWNAVRSTDTHRHGRAPARRADPAASTVWAPQKLDLGRLLGPQVTPGPNGGQIGGFCPPLIS